MQAPGLSRRGLAFATASLPREPQQLWREGAAGRASRPAPPRVGLLASWAGLRLQYKGERPCPGYSAEAGASAGTRRQLETYEPEGLKKRQRSASSRHSQPQPLRMRLLGKLRASAASSAPLEPAFSNVLTPNRIPEFFIPPRLPTPYAPESSPPAAALPRRCAAEPDLWLRGADDGAGRTDWDPRSQAALSLPHLPRALTAYGFCALLESPHTRRKESLFLGSPSSAALPPAPRPRAHTYGGGGGDAPLAPGARSPIATPAARGGPSPSLDTLAPPPRCRRLLRAPEGLLRRALRAGRSRGLARARSVSSGDGEDDDEDESRASPGSPTQAPVTSLSPHRDPRPERLEAEGTVTLGRAGGALRLAAEYNRASGRLRVRLLRAEGPAGGAAEPRAPVGCRISFVLKPRGAVVRRSRRAVLEQDLCLDGLSEDEVRRLAVRVKAENRGRGLERGRLLGQGELLLGPLLLL